MRKFFKDHPEYSFDPCTGDIFGKDGRILKGCPNHHGYLLVTFCENGEQKNYRIHRLIAEEEIPNPDNLDTVDHIDGNKCNNAAENLRWLSRSENTRLGRLGKTLSDETKRKLSEAGKKYWASKKKNGEIADGNK